MVAKIFLLLWLLFCFCFYFVCLFFSQSGFSVFLKLGYYDLNCVAILLIFFSRGVPYICFQNVIIDYQVLDIKITLYLAKNCFLRFCDTLIKKQQHTIKTAISDNGATQQLELQWGSSVAYMVHIGIICCSDLYSKLTVVSWYTKIAQR